MTAEAWIAGKILVVLCMHWASMNACMHDNIAI